MIVHVPMSPLPKFITFLKDSKKHNLVDCVSQHLMHDIASTKAHPSGDAKMS